LSDLAAIAQLLGLSIINSELVWRRANGLAEHPDTFGMMSSLAVLISIQFLVATRKLQLLTLVALVANIMGLIASGTLSAMMVVAVGVGVTIIARRSQVGKLVLSAFACAVALWLVATFSGVFEYFPSVQQRYLEVTGQSKGESSWEFRTVTYQFAWSKIIHD